MDYLYLKYFKEITFLLEKLDESEEKLVSLCETKKRDVSDQINKIIDYLKQLEDDLYTEIDEFKNNRLW